jgi:hypothetical protein
MESKKEKILLNTVASASSTDNRTNKNPPTTSKASQQ